MKENKLLCSLISFFIIFSLAIPVSSTVASVAPVPPATEIRDWYDLHAIRDNLGGNYLLMNDLDSTTAGYAELASPTANDGKGWERIGAWDPYDYYLHLAFTGTFDGQKYEIRDLFIGRPAQDEMGLFGYVAEGGVVENVSVVNATVTGKRYVGGLVALDSGIVRNCYSTGKMAGDWWVGGLVGGIHDGTVTNCHSSASVDGHEGEVGGLAGRNWGTISNSYSTGSVTCEWAWAGGLVGDNRGTVTNSYSTGSVTGHETVGGLVGGYEVEEGTVSNSFWDTETSGQATSDGGTGKTTAEMQDIATFSGAAWDITAVAFAKTNPAYTWNIVDGETYPFLSWEQPREAPVVQYTLTISSTSGGSVTTPGEGTFEYDAGTVVSLVATPATGYGFVNWSGDVGTIANVNDAETTITMEGDYEITARFMAGVVVAKTERVTDSGIVRAIKEADTEVEVTGNATVTVARYYENPGGPPPTGSSPLSSLDKYIDVYSPDTKEATEFVIKLYYTDAELAEAGINETSLRLFWSNGTKWLPCSPDTASGVNTTSTKGYSGYIWAKITDTTTPSLANLQGTPFGGYGHPTETDGCFIATAAYGTETAKEPDILREFRDTFLLPNSLGAEFVSLYYKISPPIANFISQHEVLRTAVRVGFVDPIVKILNWTHNLGSARGS